ncbi:hypothetical protein ACU5AX_07325 [Sphingomonas sp. XXL09]|uniref:hypothetical protein n=1 Tax=Sphingomonas sp. XXL09 TaxID=3457787 RepID=UPI00406BB480
MSLGLGPKPSLDDASSSGHAAPLAEPCTSLMPVAAIKAATLSACTPAPAMIEQRPSARATILAIVAAPRAA